MTPDNVQALPVGTLLGDYRLDAVIGHGGFGITYRAFDSQLAKVVAIKEYLPIEFAVRQGDKVVPRGARFAEDFAWGRERFLDEARALARFRHPHIVPVLRFLAGNGTAYTVMEFEDGRSLAELLREPGRRLPPDEVRRVAEGLLLGLGAVHAQGFLHRDIKPSNIMIRRDGVPILIDFGAARQAIGNRTRTLTSVLTPQYAPIEQFAAEGKQGPWSDIYSAAAVLHHAVTGAPPPEAAGRVGTDSYRPLAETQAGFDKTFLAAIDAALAFAPEQRPQSVAEWSRLFGMSLPHAHDAPTQRMEPAPAAMGVSPRLGGVSREPSDAVAPPRRRVAPWLLLVLLLVIGGALWRYQGQLRALLSPPVIEASAPPAPAPAPQPAPAPAPTALPPPLGHARSRDAGGHAVTEGAGGTGPPRRGRCARGVRARQGSGRCRAHHGGRSAHRRRTGDAAGPGECRPDHRRRRRDLCRPGERRQARGPGRARVQGWRPPGRRMEGQCAERSRHRAAERWPAL
jgi:hypothetical protein